MPMKVEAAIVTQKRAEASFNTDSVNVNGKVFPRDVIKNGYKGSGIISGSVYFALTSSVVDGFADAAVAAFNERAQVFDVAKDARTVFSGFYEDCRNALLNMGRKENDLTCAGFFAKGRKVVLAGNEGVKLYLSRLGNCTPVTPEKVIDTTADYSSSVFSDVTSGDIFILLSPGSAEVISEKEIEDICRISDGSVKRIVNYITKVGLAKDGENAVSAIVVKILETAAEEEITAPAFVPDFGAIEEKAETASVETEASEDTETIKETAVAEEHNEESSLPEAVAEEITEKTEDYSSDESVSVSLSEEEKAIAEEYTEKAEIKEDAVPVVIDSDEVAEDTTAEEIAVEDKKEKTDKRTRVILFSILGVLVVISVILIGVIFANSDAFSGSEETTVSEETTQEEQTTDAETTEEESSDEVTEEDTSEEKTTEEESLTEAETTTKKPQNTVVPEAPAVSTTVQSVETTASAIETTSQEEITSEEAPSESEEPSSENTEDETEPPAEEEPATEEAPSEESPAENTEENTAAAE